VAIRPLEVADATACDEIIRSLPYHFGDPDGRRECAEAVRASAGLVAVRDGQVARFLWPGSKALLLAMPLDG
jgi:hypothetical protein